MTINRNPRLKARPSIWEMLTPEEQARFEHLTRAMATATGWDLILVRRERNVLKRRGTTRLHHLTMSRRDFSAFHVKQSP